MQQVGNQNSSIMMTLESNLYLPPPPSSAIPRYTFPAFFLSLLTALEAEPRSIPTHLDSLSQHHAAKSAFIPTADKRPLETDQIVAALERIAKRLIIAEGETNGEEREQQVNGTSTPAEGAHDHYVDRVKQTGSILSTNDHHHHHHHHHSVEIPRQRILSGDKIQLNDLDGSVFPNSLFFPLSS